MKEKWLKFCSENSGGFRNPKYFYKNIGCSNWPLVQTCDIDLNEAEKQKERVCNFSSPWPKYVRQAMIEMSGK